MDRTYQYHFTPSKGWTNDPNGLVYVNGVYHLFYQHYPEDIVWGPMHWGHAVSRDLIHWEHKPVAIYPTETEYIFSGSCVYDKENVSGLGIAEQPPLVALYTAHNPATGEQQQCVAYSTDLENFKKFEGNPVIKNTLENAGFQKDFRDPKVFINTVKGGFSLVLAAGPKLEFYHSENLLSWKKTGEFDPGVRGFSGICECPDCFPLETEEGVKWVLTVSMILSGEKVGMPVEERGFINSHVMQYFVGEFNGDTFADTECAKTPLILDYGLDNYAMVSFLHSPEPLLLGWGENWDYVYKLPAEKVRGKMTLARRCQLVKTNVGWRLRFEPVGDVNTKDRWDGVIPVGTSQRIYAESDDGPEMSVTKDEISICGISAKRVQHGDCKVTALRDGSYFEIFADGGVTVFSVSVETMNLYQLEVREKIESF